jgi:hypothetical protein
VYRIAFIKSLGNYELLEWRADDLYGYWRIRENVGVFFVLLQLDVCYQ